MVLAAQSQKRGVTSRIGGQELWIAILMTCVLQACAKPPNSDASSAANPAPQPLPTVAASRGGTTAERPQTTSMKAFVGHLINAYDILEAHKTEPAAAAAALDAYMAEHHDELAVLAKQMASVWQSVENDSAQRPLLLKLLDPPMQKAALLTQSHATLMNYPDVARAMAKLTPNENTEALRATPAPAPDSARVSSASNCEAGSKPCGCTDDNRCMGAALCQKCCAGIGPAGIAGCGFPPRKPDKPECNSHTPACTCALGFKCMAKASCQACCGSVDTDPTTMPEACWN
jgi:hypothetical protein